MSDSPALSTNKPNISDTYNVTESAALLASLAKSETFGFSDVQTFNFSLAKEASICGKIDSDTQKQIRNFFILEKTLFEMILRAILVIGNGVYKKCVFHRKFTVLIEPSRSTSMSRVKICF